MAQIVGFAFPIVVLTGLVVWGTYALLRRLLGRWAGRLYLMGIPLRCSVDARCQDRFGKDRVVVEEPVDGLDRVPIGSQGAGQRLFRVLAQGVCDQDEALGQAGIAEACTPQGLFHNVFTHRTRGFDGQDGKSWGKS